MEKYTKSSKIESWGFGFLSIYRVTFTIKYDETLNQPNFSWVDWTLSRKIAEDLNYWFMDGGQAPQAHPIYY